MKQELIDRMVAYIRHDVKLETGNAEARAIVAELDRPDYLVIAREICALADTDWSAMYRGGNMDANPGVQYALEQLERAAGLRG